MSDTCIEIKPNGMVEHIRRVVLKSTTITDFYKEMEKLGQDSVTSPILPRGSICYSRNAANGNINEFVTMFFASQKINISFRRMSDSLSEEAVNDYEIAMPHLLLRQDFINGRINQMYSGVVKKVPEHPQESVYLLAMPNIYEDGRVCIPLEGTPGDMVSTCQRNVDLFFGQAPFSDDMIVWPPDIRDFAEWERKTRESARFILDVEWDYMCKLSEFLKGNITD